MYEGSCLCGEITYRISCEPERVSHCHCSMCQKQHGAAFATYASFPKEDLMYLSGQQLLSSFASSGGIERKFCCICGSSIEWCGSLDYPDWVSIAISTLDTAYYPINIVNIHTSNSVCWFDFGSQVHNDHE